MTQSILFDIIARDKASSTFSKVGESAAKSESHLKKFGETAKVLAGVAGAAVVGGGMIDFLKESIDRGEQAQRVTALTAQVIKTTGGAAHVSAAQVHELSTAISEKTGIDNQQIQSGANMLLTFKNIRNEAGKGNKIFDQTVQATTDMAAAMAAASGGQMDFRSASIRLGKALNDPVKGLTALARVGVQFTDQQKKQIKALVDSGHTMQAQKLILRELKSEFGGAAATQSTESDRARVAVKNLEEQIGTALLPTVDRLAKFVTDEAVPAISHFVKGMQDGTGAGGEFAHDLHEIYDIGKGVVSFLNGLPGPVKKFAVEGTIAAIMLSKLSNGLTSSKTGLTGFVNGLGPAERGMTRTQAAASSLTAGLRNLAGAGGMLAVVDGAKRGDSALGALEVTAGAAATGFAVGGPLGAGIGAAAGGLYSLYKAATDTREVMKSSLPTMTQYTSTLDGVGAATSRATREMVLERLQKSGLLQETQALNISDRDAIQAAMGNAAARRRVTAALAAAVSEGKNYQALDVANKLGAETTAINSSRVAQLRKNLALAGTRAEAQRIQAALDRLGATDASPRISLITGDTVSRLTAIQGMIRELTGTTHVVSIQQHVTGGLGNLLGAGHRATGGPVIAGQAYIVGEKRPELFVPNQSGRIIPNVPPSATHAGAAGSVAGEQSMYRAMMRALSDSSTVITTKPNLDALDLLVGTA